MYIRMYVHSGGHMVKICQTGTYIRMWHLHILLHIWIGLGDRIKQKKHHWAVQLQQEIGAPACMRSYTTPTCVPHYVPGPTLPQPVSLITWSYITPPVSPITWSYITPTCVPYNLRTLPKLCPYNLVLHIPTCVRKYLTGSIKLLEFSKVY